MTDQRPSSPQESLRPGHLIGRVGFQANEAKSRLQNRNLAEYATRLVDQLGDARIWHVSSTSTGGGVAELLWSSIAYQQALELPIEWLIADADPKFFQLTKRIHHGLHGRGTALYTDDDRNLYRSETSRAAAQLVDFVKPGDIVLLHDPQTAGIAPWLMAAGIRVGWRSHIGTRNSTSATEATWEFLRPYLQDVPCCVLTDPDFGPPYFSPGQYRVIKPSIDPSSAKNRELSEAEQGALLNSIGLTGSAVPSAIGYVIQDEPLPANCSVVTQVSRWDPLKDVAGVLSIFAATANLYSRAHLLLVGPDPADIPDDPEGAAVFAGVQRAWTELPAKVRCKVHLVVLSLNDLTANGLIVNAIQRRSTIVVQKSFEEGFGLTVTEAMWKSRAVVVSNVGGLITQIEDGKNGVVADPHDYEAWAEAINELLSNPAKAARLGEVARKTCEERFLVERELGDYFDLYTTLLNAF